ncbi:MAG: DUF2189 domain-containing protein [Rhodospirillales bacterium]|nr:DUF2189 domain-containing protein [Rhodospirillales bacterium]
MAQKNSAIGVDALTPDDPVIHSIRVPDLKEALVKGIADFNAMPTHLIFLCLIYPIVTVLATWIYSGHDALPLIFPLLAGYTMIGPLVAVGLYELSRRREKGLDHSRWKAFHVLQRHSIRSISILGTMLMVLYLAWLFVAWTLYVVNFGTGVPESVMDFTLQVLTTGSGWALIIVGGSIGFFFAVVVFSLSVVSFPMVLDRDVRITTAIQTSIRAVLANPVTMGIWGLIVAVVLVIASLPFFVGLSVALPILGHATWHLYRKVVAH